MKSLPEIIADNNKRRWALDISEKDGSLVLTTTDGEHWMVIEMEQKEAVSFLTTTARLVPFVTKGAAA